jgi:hypothetical protein
MRGSICGVLALVVAAGMALPVGGQVAKESDSGTKAEISTQVTLLPYIAEFKTTTVKRNINGKVITAESTEVDTIDSQGRRMTATTESSSSTDQPAETKIQVSDPVSHSLSYWSLPGTSAMVVNTPDLGGPDTDCAAKVKAIDPLHPATAQGEKPPVEDLGTATILGIETHGGRISFTPSVFRSGNNVPPVRTNEMWTATDPGLSGLMVRLMSNAGSDKMTRELVRFNQSEPAPAVFKVPAGRTITRIDGHAYSCGKARVITQAPPPPA